jgi:hypothetical protein
MEWWMLMARMSKAQMQKVEDAIKEDLRKDLAGSKLKKKIVKKRAPRKTMVPAKYNDSFLKLAEILKAILEDRDNRIPGIPFMPENAVKKAVKVYADRSEEDKKEVSELWAKAYANKQTMTEKLFQQVTKLKFEEKNKTK